MVDFDQIVVGMMATLIIVIVFMIAPIINGQIENTSYGIIPGEYASGTITFSGATIPDQYINVSSENYLFVNLTVVGANDEFEVPFSATSAAAATNFTEEVNTNSTRVRAVNNGDSTVTLYALTPGPGGNQYGTTENCTNAAFRETSLRGGEESDWNQSTNSDLPTGVSQWSDNASIVSVTLVGLFASILMMSIMKLRKG